MKTDDLIASLAQRPVPPQGGLYWPLVLVLLASLAGLGSILGLPFPALPAIGPAPYVMKLSFALSVAVLAVLALFASGRPGRPMRLLLAGLAVPFVALAVLTAMELASLGAAPAGQSWRQCLLAIALLAPPAFAAAIAATRRLAPTRLRLSGALAGTAGGGIAAAAYAPWCPETTATFLLAWYAGPILLAAVIGALAGPRLLRW